MDKPGISVEASERGEEIRLGGKLGEMTLGMQVLTLAIWPLLEQILSFFVGMTDILIAGRMAVGAERVALLDALGLGGYVGWFIYIFQGAVATGVMALVSRATGARDSNLANRGLGQGVWLGALAGCAALVILQIGAPYLIKWMGLSAAAAVESERYIRMLAWSGPLSRRDVFCECGATWFWRYEDAVLCDAGGKPREYGSECSFGVRPRALWRAGRFWNCLGDGNWLGCRPCHCGGDADAKKAGGPQMVTRGSAIPP